MQLHFQSYGAGHPLIILHGLLGSLDNWRSVSLELANGFQVLAVDQRNHGRSPHAAEMNYTVMAEDICELMDWQKLGRVHLLGHSMGGKTAMQLALRHPDRVARLVVVDIAPHLYPPRHAKILSAMLALDLSRFKSRTEVQEALGPSIPDLSLRQFLLKNIESDTAVGLRWRIGLREISTNYDRLRQPITSDIPFNHACQFVRGENSDYLKETDWPSIQRLFPQARLETIPRARHWVHVENPEVFLRTVRQFLQNN